MQKAAPECHTIQPDVIQEPQGFADVEFGSITRKAQCL